MNGLFPDELPEQKPASNIVSLFPDDPETTKLNLAVDLARDKTPDVAARVLKLQMRTGLPSDMIERNLDEVEKQAERADFNADAYRVKSPLVSKWLAEHPDHAAVAKDDFNGLAMMEQLVTHGRDIGGAAAQGVIGQGAGATLSGAGELYGVGVRATGRVLDAVLPASAMEVLRKPILPWWTTPEQILKRPGQALKDVGEDLGPPKERENLATDVSSGIGQLGFQIATFLATGGTLSTVTMLSQGADVMADKTAGDDAEPAARDTAILTGGAVTAITEKYGLEKILNRVPPEIKNRTLRFIADKIAAGGIEAAQEFTEGLLHDVARRTLTNEDAPLLEGVNREMSAAALTAMIVRTALGVKGHRQAKQDQQLIEALATESNQSTLRERVPAKYAELVARLTKNGPLENIHIPAEQFGAYFQAQGGNVEHMAESLGVTNYSEALATGGDIAIPMSKFLADIAPTDHLQGLMPDLRFDPETLTAREQQAMDKDRGAKVDEILGEFEKGAGIDDPVNEAAEAVYQDTLGQLMMTGKDRATAEREAVVNKAAFRSLARRINEQRASQGDDPIDPMTLFKPYDLSINRPLPEALRKIVKVKTDIDPYLDMLRTGNAPKKDAPKSGETRAILTDLGKYLGEQNIDLQTMDNAAVREALKGGAVESKGETLDQGTEKSRGQLTIGANRKMTISLFEGANLSTYLHESAHFYLEVLGDLSQRDDAPQQMRDDFEKLTKFAGMTADKWRAASLEERRAGHEKIAEAFEVYLSEGKAPSEELRPVFARFRSWLLDVYRKTRLYLSPDKITHDVRQVFDRLLATDDEIETAQEQQAYVDLFTTADDAGMTPETFANYRKAAQAAHEKSVTDLNLELQEGWKREAKAYWKEQRAEVEAEVIADTNRTPVYVALAAMRTGKQPNGSPLGDDIEIAKLSKPALEQMYGKQSKGNTLMTALKHLGLYTKEGGTHPDAAAQLYGFRSGDEMVQAMINAPPMEAYIKAETDARMRERFPDPLTDGSIAERAMHAVHNDKRADVMARELAAIKRKQREVKPFLRAEQKQERAAEKAARGMTPDRIEMAAIKEAARLMIARKRVRDINPQAYRVAEAKAGRDAFKAAAKKDWDKAYTAKRQQLVNLELYRQSVEAQREIAKTRDYMAGLTSKRIQERVGLGGAAYLDALNALLEGYEFRRVSKNALNVREAMRAALAEAEANGEVIDVLTDDKGNIVDPAILNSRNYQELTFEELEGVRDAAINIVHVATEANRFRMAERKATFDEIVTDSLNEMDQGRKGKPMQRTSLRTPMQDKARFISGIPASWRGLYSYIAKASGYQEIDKGLNNTTLWNYIVRPLNEAAAKEAAMLHDTSKRLTAIFSKYKSDYLYGKGKEVPGVGAFSLQDRIMMAASWGTDTGRQRMLSNGFDGKGFTQAEVDKVFDTLSERDWQTVQELWTLMGEFWPLVEAKQRRVTGVPPKAVTPLPFKTKFGDMPGGYSPIAYETLGDNKAAEHDAAQVAKEMKQGAYTASTTRRGFTKQRVKAVKGRKVRYDFGVVTRHINEVIHDLTHHEALRDVQKTLTHKVAGRSILDEITEQLGPNARDEIKQTLDDIAVGNLRAMSATERAMEWVAKGATIGGLAYNVWSALQNVTGIFNSMGVIGPRAVFSGAMEWIGSPSRMLKKIDEVNEKSEFMRTRFLNMTRDVATFKAQLDQQTGLPALDTVRRGFTSGAFWMMVRVQQLVDMPTWLGAYRSAFRADPNMTEKNAIALADQAVVEAQGGGRTVDMSAFIRTKGWGRVFTVHAGYFNVTYQRLVESFERAGVRGYTPEALGRMATDIAFLAMAPVILTVAMKEAVDVLSGGDLDDEDEAALKLIKEQLSYLLAMFPFLREMSAGLFGYGPYSGPVGARIFKDWNNFATQIQQGEVDEAAVKAGIRSVGYFTGLPSTQILKTMDGVQAYSDGDAEPAAFIFGPPKD